MFVKTIKGAEIDDGDIWVDAEGKLWQLSKVQRMAKGGMQAEGSELGRLRPGQVRRWMSGRWGADEETKVVSTMRDD